MNYQAYTIEEFAQAHRICRATVYNLIKAGSGPRTMKVGARTLITMEAAAEWRRRMEGQPEGRAA